MISRKRFKSTLVVALPPQVRGFIATRNEVIK